MNLLPDCITNQPAFKSSIVRKLKCTQKGIIRNANLRI